MTRLLQAGPGARLAPALVAAALALLLAACSDGLPTGAAAGTTALQLRAAVTGTTADAFAKTDAAHVHLTQSDAVLLDTVVSFSGSGGGEISLAVRLPNPSGTVALTLELTSRGQALFRGSGSAVLRRGTSTPLEVTLAPIVTLLAPDSVRLTALGDTARLGGAAVFATGDTLSPAQLTWTSDGGGVVRVTPDGLAIALAEGVAQATLSGQGLSHVTRVRVQAIVTRVTLSADTFSLLVGSSRTLTAAALDRRGNALVRTLTWQSSNTSVATVDGAGRVTGVAPGTATITASSEGQSASATVTVRRIPVAAVRVTPASSSVLLGGTVQLTATTYDAAGNVLTGRVIAWASGNPAVASVSGTGLVTAIAAGSATITATSEGVTGTADVTVTRPILAVSPGQLSFQAVAAAGPPPAQVVSVFNAGSGSIAGLTSTVNYAAGQPTGWITSSSLSSSTVPATVTVAVSPAGQDPGVPLNATLVIDSDAGTVSIPVSFTVTQPFVAVSTNSVTISTRDTTTHVVQVTNAGSGTLTGLTVSTPTYGGCLPSAGCPTGWLNASLSGSTAPTTLNLQHGFGNLYSGLTATVTVTSSVPGAGSQQVTVTLQ